MNIVFQLEAFEFTNVFMIMFKLRGCAWHTNQVSPKFSSSISNVSSCTEIAVYSIHSRELPRKKLSYVFLAQLLVKCW